MPVYVVDKPLGLTSHDVVAQSRKRLRTKRVGHAGTLDPLASGVLVILSEDATKLSPFLTDVDKAYLAWVSFGAATPTLDAEGPITDTAPTDHLDAARIEAAFAPFLELSEQRPPQFSAVKKGGVKSYEAARRGETLDLPPRPAGYRDIRLLGFAAERDTLPIRFRLGDEGHWEPHPQGREMPLPDPLGVFPTALISLVVRSGTYIRSFARDLGGALDTEAHLGGLVRTRSGRTELTQAVTIDDLADAEGLSKAAAIPFERLELSPPHVTRIRQGQHPPLDLNPTDKRVALIDPDGKLVAVVEPQGEGYKLLRVWAE